MKIRRIAISAAVLAAVATPLSAGIASAILPGTVVIHASGSGQTVDAAKDSANQAIARIEPGFCFNRFYDTPTISGGQYSITVNETCRTR